MKRLPDKTLFVVEQEIQKLYNRLYELVDELGDKDTDLKLKIYRDIKDVLALAVQAQKEGSLPIKKTQDLLDRVGDRMQKALNAPHPIKKPVITVTPICEEEDTGNGTGRSTH